jgi:acyl-CoA thioesterase-1
MKTHPFLALLLCLPLALLAQTAKPEKGGEKKRDPSLEPITDTPGLPRVLLIGDSISMGYTIPVRELLKGKASVHRIPANGSSTDVGLAQLKTWLGDGKWDVIHFNWGLHDLKHWKDGKLDDAGPVVNSLEAYEKNLRELVKQLKATGAKLVWATTTPVPEGAGGRKAGDEVKYNEAAARVMKAEGVPTDDLHALAASRLAEIQREKNVHFSEPGYRVLAEKVAASIRSQLPR